MKKYFILSLLLCILLVGCSTNHAPERGESTRKTENTKEAENTKEVETTEYTTEQEVPEATTESVHEELDPESVSEFYRQICTFIKEEDEASIEEVVSDGLTEEDIMDMFNYKDNFDPDDEVQIVYQDDGGAVIRNSVGVALGIVQQDGSLSLSGDYYNDHCCSNCGGTGQILTDGDPCAICGGTGQEYNPSMYYDASLGWQGGYQVCSGCGGSGKVGASYTVCGACGGAGFY